MDTSMHGKEISRIATSEGCYLYPGVVTGRDLTRFKLSATYHGDRDEFWVVKVDGKGNELVRYNTKTLHAIEWAATEGAAHD